MKAKERLTRKLDGYRVPERDYVVSKPYTIDEWNAINKLGKLEDIEEELGIDLLTLYLALKNGCFVVDVGKNIVVVEPDRLMLRTDLGIENALIDVFNKPHRDDVFLSPIPKVKDYGKTWALTKEELEK